MDKKYDVIFFDLDGTLWNFDKNAENAMKIIYDHYNLQRYTPRFHKFWKVYERENNRLWAMYRKGLVTRPEVSLGRFERSLRNIGAPIGEALEMSHLFLEKLAHQTELCPGTRTMLDALRGNYRLAIITNGFAEVQSLKLKNSGLDVYFDVVVTSENAQSLKPQRAIFEYALQAMSVTAERALMVGDDYQADVLGARMAEIDQVWYVPPHIEPRGKATHIIGHLEQLIPILAI